MCTVSGKKASIAVFFNIFDAAEPHRSVKVTHRTPMRIDS